MKYVVSVSFHVALLSPSLSRSLCLTLMVHYKMWPVDVHMGTKKTHFSYASNFIWMTLLPGQGLALSPSISFSHFFISQFQSFIFTIRIAPTQGRPAIPHCSCAQNYHNSYDHFFFSTRFISGWTMQKIKTVIPKSHEHAHCLKICYWELNPYHFVRRMNRLPFKSRSNAWIWASELWKDAVGGRLRAHCREKNTHANTHIDMNFIWNHFVDPLGDMGSQPGSERDATPDISLSLARARSKIISKVLQLLK